jgi:hypothetical protein
MERRTLIQAAGSLGLSLLGQRAASGSAPSASAIRVSREYNYPGVTGKLLGDPLVVVLNPRRDVPGFDRELNVPAIATVMQPSVVPMIRG